MILANITGTFYAASLISFIVSPFIQNILISGSVKEILIMGGLMLLPVFSILKVDKLKGQNAIGGGLLIFLWLIPAIGFYLYILIKSLYNAFINIPNYTSFTNFIGLVFKNFFILLPLISIVSLIISFILFEIVMKNLDK